MRSHEEVFERIKRKTLLYEQQQKRKPRTFWKGLSVAVPVAVVVIGLLITASVQFGWIGKKQETGTEEATPTAEVSATPELSPDVSPEPTEPVTPAPTAEPTPTGEPGRFAVIKLNPTPTPVAHRSDSPEPTPEGVTDEIRAKISEELSYLEGSDEEVWIYVSYRSYQNYWLRTLYPDEYGAYNSKWFCNNRSLFDWETDSSFVDKKFMENWEETVYPKLSKGEFSELYARGKELMSFPWMQDRREGMLQKYPKLAQVPQEILDGEWTRETKHASYREILELAQESYVDRILSYENSIERTGRRVVGLYNGHNVHDAFKADFFYYVGYTLASKAGDLYDCISQLGWDKVGDEDYLRISFQLDPDWNKAKAMLQEKYGAPNGDGSLNEWLTGEEGQAASKAVCEELTKVGCEKVWNLGWPVLAEEMLPAVGNPGIGRCISVLATKAQLLSFVPELTETVQADWYDYNIGTQSVDPNSVLTVFFTGSVANVQDIGRVQVD